MLDIKALLECVVIQRAHLDQDFSDRAAVFRGFVLLSLLGHATLLVLPLLIDWKNDSWRKQQRFLLLLRPVLPYLMPGVPPLRFINSVYSRTFFSSCSGSCARLIMMLYVILFVVQRLNRKSSS